jgi:HSP20 family protein
MNTLQIFDPFAEANVDDLFRGFFKPVRVAREGAVARIKVDVAEKGDAYTVHAEVPGVAKEDIQVTIEGNQVTIAAEVKRAPQTVNGGEKDDGRVLRSERYYGAVARTFVLPVELDETASEAKYENGVLQLTLKKKAAQAGRKLTIQ